MALSFSACATLLAFLVFISLTSGAEICVQSFYINQDIDMFGNYTDLVSFRMDCSHPGFPSLYITAEPPLREQISLSNSRNAKVAFSIRCEKDNTTRYLNRSVGVRKSEPWFNKQRYPDFLELGQNCSVFGCFWDSYNDHQRRFAVEGSTCITNLNECAMNERLCGQVCQDTVTGYECSCFPGYRLANDLHNCTDVNECDVGSSRCSHGCSNIEGGYLCSCLIGYTLLDDNATCTDVDECSAGVSPCDHSCINTAGSFECQCRVGFTLSDDQTSCEDIDECDPQSGVDHKCQHWCSNVLGSYVCSCDPGFSLSSNHHDCIGVGECENPRVCPHICVNTSGDYYCQCHSGYELGPDGHNCTAKSSLGEGVLVVYMPWAVPLACIGLLLLLALSVYYSINRRRKNGHILETNHDLYEFYLTQEKIDCSYQPVDLSHGLQFDSESLHSAMTMFQSTSNTADDLANLAGPEMTRLVVVPHDSTLKNNNEEGVAAVSCDGGEGGGGEREGDGKTEAAREVTPSQEVVIEFGKSLGSFSAHNNSHDSCVGSSIAGDTSSGFHTSTVLCTPDTVGESYPHSTDTSANSDYIATSCESSQSPPLPRRFQDITNTALHSSTAANLSKPTTDIGPLCQKTESVGVLSDPALDDGSSSDRDRKTFTKTKDYIHATNALFSVVEGRHADSSPM